MGDTDICVRVRTRRIRDGRNAVLQGLLTCIFSAQNSVILT